MTKKVPWTPVKTFDEDQNVHVRENQSDDQTKQRTKETQHHERMNRRVLKTSRNGQIYQQQKIDQKLKL